MLANRLVLAKRAITGMIHNMNAVKIVAGLLPVFVSAVLLAAHFLRPGRHLPAIASLAFPFVLLFPRRWAAYLMQIALSLAALGWVWIALKLIVVRQSIGRPWSMLAIILFSVAAFTAASSQVFRFGPLKERYQLGRRKIDSEQ